MATEETGEAAGRVCAQPGARCCDVCEREGRCSAGPEAVNLGAGGHGVGVSDEATAVRTASVFLLDGRLPD